MFDLAERFKRPDLLEALLITASPQLLVEGRLPTLTKWLAAAANIASPAVDLVHAELARRQGDYVKSEVLALEAARLLPRDHALTARAFLCAGQSAHLLDREEAAAKHLARARALADDPLLKLEAIRGEFIVAVAREAPDAFDKFAQFERLCSPSPLDQVRLATARLSLAHHFAGAMGGIQNAIFYANRAEPLIPRLADPLIRTSFLNRYAYSLSLLGQYHEALVTIARLFTEADKYELPFVRPYAYVTKAAALLGLRRFSEAEESLNHARASERWGQGRFLAINCCVLDAKLKLAQDLPGAAQRIIRQDVRNASVPDVLGEYVGTKALVQAVAGRLDEALSLASEAANLTHHVEATVLAAATRAVVALRSSGSAQAIDAFAAAVRDSGNIDGLVISYRAYHPLALALSRTDFASDLDAVFERANDHGIAESVHDSLADSFANPKLTARETEVLRLLTGGLSNRQIAEALFLSEATVKVHIRRVFLKIRVRTRTQAAMKASLHGL